MRHTRYFLSRLLLMFLGVLTPLLALHAYTLYDNYRSAERRAFEEVLSRSKEIARDLDDEFSRAERLLNLLARRDELRPSTPEKCQSLLEGFGAIHNSLANVIFADMEGRLVCAARTGKTPLPYTDAIWFNQATVKTRTGEDKVAFEAPFASRISNEALAVFSIAIRDESRHQVGVAAVAFDLPAIAARMSVGMPHESVAALLNAGGVFLTRYPDPEGWVGKRVPVDVLAKRNTNPYGVIRVTTADGVERLMAAATLKHFGLRATTGVRYDSVHDPLKRDLARSMAATVLSLLLMSILAWLGGKHVSRPLRQMVITLRNQRRGQHDVRMPEGLPGEFGDVAVEFNRLTDARQADEARLRMAQLRAQRLADFNAGLSGLTSIVRRVRSAQELYQELCKLCVTTLKARAAWVGAIVEGQLRTTATCGMDVPGPDGTLIELNELGPERWGAAEHVMRSGLPVVINAYLNSTRTALWRDTAVRHGIRSAGVFPLRYGDKVAGVLILYFKEADFFDDALISVIGEFTTETAFAFQDLMRDAAHLQAGASLQWREQQLAAVFGNTSDAVFTVGRDRRIQLLNESAGKMLQVTPQAAQGQLLTTFLPEGSELGLVPLEGWQQRQLMAVRTDGSKFSAEVSVSSSGSGVDAMYTLVLRELP